jgi:hypothetical protein
MFTWEALPAEIDAFANVTPLWLQQGPVYVICEELFNMLLASMSMSFACNLLW